MIRHFGIVGNPGNRYLDSYLQIVLASSILGYLSIKGWTNISLFLLLLPALLSIKAAWDSWKSPTLVADLRLVILCLALPVLAILISQSLRGVWLLRAYDGPARLLLSIPLFLYFGYKRLDFARLLRLSAPIALLLLVPVVHSHPDLIARWGNRFATPFVDPNAFGTYTLVLAAFCLLSVKPALTANPRWQVYLSLVGLTAGLYLVAGSETRGSWLTFPILLLLWLVLNRPHLGAKALAGLGSALILGLIFTLWFSPELSDRLFSSFRELLAWLDGSDPDTSTGQRLTMWRISWELFQHSPWAGYGDTGFLDYLDKPWIETISTVVARETFAGHGPHNELLANLLRSGVLGGIAALGLLFVPGCLFWRHRNLESSQLGLALITCLLFSGISIEVLTLKYTNSFYGIVIAGLTAQTLRAQSGTPDS